MGLRTFNKRDTYVKILLSIKEIPVTSLVNKQQTKNKDNNSLVESQNKNKDTSFKQKI